jgi:AcrR family transcriptional regulator
MLSRRMRPCTAAHRQEVHVPGADETALVKTGQPPQDGLSRKAHRTRERLIDAASAVFARDGFIDARISDIAAAAEVAHGTFYTYFDSKEAIFREVVFRLGEQMRQAPPPSRRGGPDPLARIEHGNRVYIRAYRENAALLASLEQVVTFSDELRQLRKEIRRPFLERNVRAIRRWQAAGVADPELDPEYAATALAAMVDRFMYIWLTLGEDFEEERAVATLTRLWAQALGIGTTNKRGAWPR